MKKIVMEIIPHNEQRYDTVGDYWEDENGDWQFKISDMNDNVYELAVFVHELLEKILCKHAGITDQEIDTFDMAYSGPEEEPGADLAAPYYEQHRKATILERLWIELTGKDWDSYDHCVMDL